ncbi:MAG: D-beta-D-heptose 7-phosphate kinase/D-beta-D-heptose 1-phosphate adenosyltransferase [Bacteroidia bacterium]|jgi:D-beta-D-heptose 7-phosphate kinase/D-beta-D-heptose 1-phosphate adenosyltransferase
MSLPDFSKANILVIGDVILDRYMNGDVNRTSPEAPVPVMLFKNEHHTIGGAANVAHNASSLGVTTKLFGLIGNDPNGRTVESRCNECGIEAELQIVGFPTITKTRVVANGQQIVRIDQEETIKIEQEEEGEFVRLIKDQAKGVGAIILSDYGKGTLSDGIIRKVKAFCLEMELPLFIDPKGMNWEKYRGAFLLSPNLKELSEAFGELLPNEDKAVEKAAQSIRQKLNLTNLLVTRSSKGMTLVNESGAVHFKAKSREVFDVSGAGDTVMAVMASAYSAGSDLNSAVEVANTAAGIVIGKLGTATVSLEELKAAKTPSNDSQSNPKKSVVFTNGCFDVLHAGHVKLLQEAKSLGTELVVGLNSDASVARLKGHNRPVNKLEDRVAVLSALSSVDRVIVFEEDTPERLLSELKPEILVKGSDYQEHEVVGREHAGKVVLVDLLPGRSTTGILSKS